MMKFIYLTLLSLCLTACSNFFEKDNTPPPTPLTQITAEVQPHQLWSTKIGNGAGDDYLKLSPKLVGQTIYTASSNGIVTATDKTTGNRLWSVDTKTRITSGPGVGNGIVVVGSHKGDVVALRQAQGDMAWKTNIPGEILANPVIGNQIVTIKAIDGTLRALSVNDGHELWSLQQTEPSLILRGSSTPVLQGRSLFVGFANGSLAKMSQRSGQVEWSRPIAIPEGGFSIERMRDIDADPVIDGHHVYAATYQGQIASLSWHSGEPLWSQDISSYTGMAVDNDTVYVSDAKSDIWAFNASSGTVRWRQTDLAARNVSAPALMGHYIVVGDSEGYLHWISKTNGHLAGRDFVGNTIQAAPLVENNIVYVLTTNGSLVAYTLG